MIPGEIQVAAGDIGAAFAATMPEYCGVISVKPTTRAKLPKVEYEETKFDFSVLENALAEARYINIDELAEEEMQSTAVDILAAPVTGAIIIDVRHPTEQERKPLHAGNVAIEKMSAGKSSGERDLARLGLQGLLELLDCRRIVFQEQMKVAEQNPQSNVAGIAFE